MGKVTLEFDTVFDQGNVVVFKKNNVMMVGIVEGYYVDSNAHNSIWYNIRTSESNVYTYTNGGDIAEYDIYYKLPDDISESLKKHIMEIY